MTTWISVTVIHDIKMPLQKHFFWFWKGGGKKNTFRIVLGKPFGSQWWHKKLSSDDVNRDEAAHSRDGLQLWYHVRRIPLTESHIYRIYVKSKRKRWYNKQDILWGFGKRPTRILHTKIALSSKTDQQGQKPLHTTQSAKTHFPQLPVHDTINPAIQHQKSNLLHINKSHNN
jgi:hypothetical protein